VIAPSGEQIEITAGDQRAVIVEVGGGLRTFSANGRELLDGYRLDEMCSSGRGQVLIPWPNRLEDGRYEFAEQSHQLPLTDVKTGNAIHGLVRWAPWEVRERDEHHAVVEHVLRPQPGYPFTLRLRIEYAQCSTMRSRIWRAGTTAARTSISARPRARTLRSGSTSTTRT
jgi:aldose 1-epimerase